MHTNRFVHNVYKFSWLKYYLFGFWDFCFFNNFIDICKTGIGWKNVLVNWLEMGIWIPFMLSSPSFFHSFMFVPVTNQKVFQKYNSILVCSIISSIFNKFRKGKKIEIGKVASYSVLNLHKVTRLNFMILFFGESKFYAP